MNGYGYQYWMNRRFFRSFGGVLPPNLDQLIQYFDGTTYESNGSTYYEDKSVSGGDVEMTRGALKTNGSNSIVCDGDCGKTQNPYIKLKIIKGTAGNEWFVNRRTNVYNESAEWQLAVWDGDLRFDVWIDDISYSITTPSTMIAGVEYTICAWVDRVNSTMSFSLDGVVIDTLTIPTSGTIDGAKRMTLFKTAWSSFYSNSTYKQLQVCDFVTDECLIDLEFDEKSNKYYYDKVSGRKFMLNGDLTDTRDVVDLETPRLIRNYSLWRHDDPDKDDIQVPYKNDGTPIATEGGTPPDVGYYWVEDYENSVEATYVTEADGFTWFRDRYDDKLNEDGTITKHPDAVQYQSMFTVPPFNSPYTFAALGEDYEGLSKMFSSPTKYLWYAARQSGVDIRAIRDNTK